MELTEKQQEAVTLCTDLNKRIVSVTGEPGTGKTTIMKDVYEKLTQQNIPVALCAPTGKAASRIKEATGIQAVTIHRLLEYPHPGERDERTGKYLGTTDPRRGKERPLEQLVILADEYAMVNREVHRNLVDALPRSGCIRVFGDKHQLAPIENYSVAMYGEESSFEEMLRRFPSVVLDRIHRQEDTVSIGINSKRINQGLTPIRRDDFRVQFTDEPVKVIQNLVKEKTIDFSSLENQIISPTNIGWIGTLALNGTVQNIYQPGYDYIQVERHPSAKRAELRLFVGDKVIMATNYYDLGVYNGEVGKVTNISAVGEILIDFGDKEIPIPPSLEVTTKFKKLMLINPQRDLELAYVITTHKSQGSEFNNVVYVLSKHSMFAQSRRNLYTACTRYRRTCHVVTDTKSLSYSLWQTKTVNRKK